MFSLCVCVFLTANLHRKILLPILCRWETQGLGVRLLIHSPTMAAPGTSLGTFYGDTSLKSLENSSLASNPLSPCICLSVHFSYFIAIIWNCSFPPLDCVFLKYKNQVLFHGCPPISDVVSSTVEQLSGHGVKRKIGFPLASMWTLDTADLNLCP